MAVIYWPPENEHLNSEHVADSTHRVGAAREEFDSISEKLHLAVSNKCKPRSQRTLLEGTTCNWFA